MGSLGVLMRENMRYWFSARGFALVLAAALVPLLLTGAWVATHQKDVAASSISWDKPNPVEGDHLNISAEFVNKGRQAISQFNVTVAVWSEQELGRLFDPFTGKLVDDAPKVVLSLSPATSNVSKVPRLGANQIFLLTTSWTATPGVFVVISTADAGSPQDGLNQFLFGIRKDQIPEIEEFNNLRFAGMVVNYAAQPFAQAPFAPGNLTGPSSASAHADLKVSNLTWTPERPAEGQNVTLHATVTNLGPDPIRNASITLRAGQAFNHELFGGETNVTAVALPPGETTNVSLTWRNLQRGTFWAIAYGNVSENATDPAAENNNVSAPLVVSPPEPVGLKFPEPSSKLTIKQFYLDILQFLHIRLLLPFIGLFYAAGVLADEKEKGNLTYILTRPLSRPLIPITKFVASFVVASVAVLAGLLVTFFLLLGTPDGKTIGFLTTPILISLISLWVYGAFFILMGVLVDRPYLYGIAWVIGWETIAGNFVPWVQNLTLSHWLIVAIRGWPFDKGLQWLPVGHVAIEALRNVGIASIVFLIASMVVMKRREFDV